MSVAFTSARHSAPTVDSPSSGGSAETSGQGNRPRTRPAAAASPHRLATDDEILGIDTSEPTSRKAESPLDPASQSVDLSDEREVENKSDGERPAESAAHSSNGDLQSALDSNPDLRQAWQDAQSYREAFATPDQARAATALLADLDRMDALFFSHRPEDHAELARAVANLDPVAFASLAQAMNNLAAGPHAANSAMQASGTTENQPQIHRTPSRDPEDQIDIKTAQNSARNDTQSVPSNAQIEFLHAANAAAVQGVLDAIETQVDRLLPEGVSKSARNRVVGEIYRELDANLGANRQLNSQIRDAFRSGNLDAAHQRAIVSLVTGRARQALPGIAKRVLNEWTSTVVAANQDRVARQRAAAHRVDIAGSGRGADGGRRALGPRDIDYTRMSDSDILNL
jgi:hypothetical protein